MLANLESEFERLLETLRRDAEQAARYGFAELAVPVLASRSLDIRDRVQEHAGFWNTALGGFQGSAFIALGRLFDRSKGTVAASKVLSFAIAHTEMFTKEALKARRNRTNPDFNEVTFDDFFKNIFEADSESLKDAQCELEKWTVFYNERVKEIRHNVFAHSLRAPAKEVEELFSRLFVRQYEELLVFPLRLLGALQQLYINGHKPDLPALPTHIHDVVAQAVDGTGRSTPEHVRAVREVNAFMQWMTLAPSAEAEARNSRDIERLV